MERSDCNELLVRSLPKVELHCHLDGSVPLGVYEAIAKRHPGRLPQGEALVSAVTAPEKCESLTHYLKSFDLPVELLKDMDNLYEATCGLVAEMAGENVIYAELRFSPMLFSSPGISFEDVTRVVLDAMQEAEAASSVPTRALLCLMRHAGDDDNMKVLKVAEKLRAEGVCGVDIAGDEAAFPPGRFRALFEYARAAGLPYTIHAGETGSAENVRTAIEMGAARIGHGIAAAKQPDLMQELAERGVLLENCPISNLQTNAVAGWADYPFETFLNAGVNICINTDNRTVSNTTLTREFCTLARHYAVLDAALVKKLTLAAVEGAFAEKPLKDRLRAEVERSCYID